MDIAQARTFLAIVAHGSFLAAARHCHITQSTVSARIQRLEDEFRARLFVRNRAGASLTPAGRRFLEHAKRLVLTADQARRDVGLPERFDARLRVGGRIALWEGILPSWVAWMRRRNHDVVIHGEIGFEDDLMPRLVEGTLDIGLMYTPRHSPGLIVEHIFDEQLVLVSTDPTITEPGEDYVYIDWGPGFYAEHAQRFPDLEQPQLTANIGWLAIQIVLHNGGSCYLPERLANTLGSGSPMQRVTHAPVFTMPTYMVYPREAESPVLGTALEGLRLAVAQ